MKKKLMALCAFLCAVSVIGVIWSYISNTYNDSISIIGGADGPTSIFLAVKIGNGILVYIIPGLLFLIITLICSILYFKSKK